MSRRGKIYAWLFFGLATSSLVNVMLLQPRLPLRGIGGTYAEQAAGGAPTTTSSSRASTRHTASASSSASSTPANPTIVATQRELSQYGLFKGAHDGIVSRGLTAAIVQYESERNLALSGEPTDALVQRLILGPTLAGSDKTTLAGQVIAGSSADELIKWVTGALAQLGFQPGSAGDGITPRLQQAIRKFQAADGLRLNGQISFDVVVALERRLASWNGAVR